MPTSIPKSTEDTANPMADPGDAIASSRSADYVRASDIQPIPKGFQVVPIDERRRRLLWVEASGRSDLIAAIKELADHAPALQSDLGDMAPDVTVLPDLASRIEGLEASIAAQQALLDAHTQMLEIALSDGHSIVSVAFGEHQHRVDRIPGLGPKYSRLVTYGGLRGHAVAQGRFRAKQVQAQVADAVADVSVPAATTTAAPAVTFTTAIPSPAAATPVAPAAPPAAGKKVKKKG